MQGMVDDLTQQMEQLEGTYEHLFLSLFGCITRLLTSL